MNRLQPVRLSTLATLVALAACTGSGGGGSEVTPSGRFLVTNTDPINAGRIFLNDPINIDFTQPVDLESANLNNLSFQVLDQLGNPVSEIVSGSFELSTTPGDNSVGRRLLFVPRFASSGAFNDGGFRAGRTYIVRLVGGTAYNGTAVRSSAGKALALPASFSFSTAEGTQPSQLFRNPLAGGPRRRQVDGLTISNTVDLNNVPLNLFGAPPVEIRLAFDQALNPSSANIPIAFDGNPLVRNINDRGRIYLEYDDPVTGNNTWIPADVELEQNNLQGAVLVLRPIGVLPNNAEIRVIVERSVEDISGESNLAELSYDRVFGRFRTQRDYTQQWNGIAERFLDAEQVDPEAVFPEPQAEVGPGYIKAGFDFEGRATTLEFEPTAREVVLNTAFTQITPKNGLPFNVSGGVFNFRNVFIPAGINVRGQGPNPMVWLCTGDFRVAGELTVRGGNGQRINVLNSANFAKPGGVGVASGGNGGDGSPGITRRSASGGSGFGPFQTPGGGGGGGLLACAANCWTGSGYQGTGGGSGGGGGSMAQQGDVRYDTLPTVGTVFHQKLGIGGMGCSGTSASRTAVLAGGAAGATNFADTRADNNFWGGGVNLASGLRIRGELAMPMGGSGGGGGGNTAENRSCSLTDPSYVNDMSGGGGGGGGGALIIKALGEIEILPTGRIIADGGNGGGGEEAGSCGEGGGGGGGAGGMVVLMSATRIIIHARGVNNRWLFRGPTTIDRDYNFAISADGGVCTTGTFIAPMIAGKYPPSGQSVHPGSLYDQNPLGGFGGMGIVQLMAPSGDNADGTNTVLDDNIDVRLPQNPPAGLTKQSVLGWRGHPNAAGTVFRDDNGTPITVDEGDIRPAPLLIPVPFSSKSRARSKWIDTGLSKRRPLSSDDGLPRGVIVGGGTTVGPTYEFEGTNLTSPVPGYVDYETVGSSGTRINYRTVVARTNLTTISASATYLGSPAYSATFASPVLGGTPNRYSQYEAELLNSDGNPVGSFRILAHDGETMFLAPDGEVLPSGVTQARVIAKFFKIVTNGAEGLGPVYLPTGTSTPVPVANVRIGFAFHTNPTPGGNGLRFPANPNAFVYNLQDTALQNWINANGAPRYVQWDVTFDSAFSVNGSVPPAMGPTSPLPELHSLRLPFRF